MNFRNEKELYLHIKNGGRIDRPLKEWERRGLLRKVQALRAAAAEAENFAFRTSNNMSAKKAEKRAKLFRMEAKILESRLTAMGLYKQRKPQMERAMKITKKRLRKIIMEEVENLEYELDKVKVDDILAAAHPSEVEAEEADSGDIFNQVDHAMAAGAEATTKGIEVMAITELRKIIRNALNEFRHWKHSPTMEEEQEMWDEGEMGYEEMLNAMELARKSEEYQQWTEPMTGKHRSKIKKKKRKPKSQSWRAKASRDPRQTKMF